jgi:hypothetical protein
VRQRVGFGAPRVGFIAVGIWTIVKA